MYKKCVSNEIIRPVLSVIRLVDGACIPFDPANTDYQVYLKWLDGYELVGREWIQTAPECNIPLPVDQG